MADSAHVELLGGDGLRRVDLRTSVPTFRNSNEIVIHAAGKAHQIPTSGVAIRDFFSINVSGTKNLLEGLQKSYLPKSFVFISTVAVYGLNEGQLVSHRSPLMAKDPYGLSKIQAEQIVQEWCLKNNVTCTILRLPLLAGPNPPGNLKAMINGIKKGYYFNIAGGTARKSMVLADDIGSIIANAAKIGGIYNLTDGYHPSFSELSMLISKQLQKKNPINIPSWLATGIAKVGDIVGARAPLNSVKLRKMTSDLTFDDSNARSVLGWNPTSVLEGFKIS